jgi:hypothetical protein
MVLYILIPCYADPSQRGMARPVLEMWRVIANIPNKLSRKAEMR